MRIFFVFPSIKGKNKQYFGEDKAKRPHRKAKVRLGEMLQFFYCGWLFFTAQRESSYAYEYTTIARQQRAFETTK